MTDILIATLVVYLVHLMLPSMLALVRKELTNDYLVGPRDETKEVSAIIGRARRASGNMQESLLVFIPLAVLAAVTGGAVAETATIWLGLRIAYWVAYLMGVSYLRTLIWFASVFCLALMALALV